MDSVLMGVKPEHQGKSLTTILGFLIGSIAYDQGFIYACIMTTTTLGCLALQKTASLKK